MALKEGTGKMATILRDYSASGYQVYFDSVDLEIIANSARFLPPEWISKSGIDVTDDFIDYAMPLIGEEMYPIPLKHGLQDFAVLGNQITEQKLPSYIPVNFRK
jgi:6-phosphofructokinase 1